MGANELVRLIPDRRIQVAGRALARELDAALASVAVDLGVEWRAARGSG